MEDPPRKSTGGQDTVEPAGSRHKAVLLLLLLLLCMSGVRYAPAFRNMVKWRFTDGSYIKKIR